MAIDQPTADKAETAPSTAEMVAWCDERYTENVVRAIEVWRLPKIAENCRRDAAMLRAIAARLKKKGR